MRTPEQKRAAARVWYSRHRDEVCERRRGNHASRDHRRRRRATLSYRLWYAQETRIRDAMIWAGSRPCAAARTLLGCEVSELEAYIVARLTPGMNESNYGRNGWHVDHIRPCASFDLTDPEQQRACFHYSNLQPMWSFANRSKKNRWEPAAVTA